MSGNTRGCWSLADTGNVNDPSIKIVFDFLYEKFRIPGILEWAFVLPDKIKQLHAIIIAAVRHLRPVVLDIPLVARRHGGGLAANWCRLAEYFELGVSFLDHVLAK